MIAISRTGRVLRRLVRLSCRRPGVTVAISLLLAAVAVAYTAHALTFKTSTRALLPQDAGYVLRYAEYAKEFGESQTSSFISRFSGTPPNVVPSMRMWHHLRSFSHGT